MDRPIMILTENEKAWIDFLRIITNDRVPGPTLRSVQALRLGLSGREIRLVEPDDPPDNSGPQK